MNKLGEYKINIPEPCSMNWNGMEMQGDGRWCKACEKVVVDFTNMSNEQILKTLAEKKEEEVCGRCNVEEVKSPKRKLGRWMASIVLFLFGLSLISSCTIHRHGKIRTISKREARQQNKMEAKSR